ncbi:hypothetical protein [Bdellovibrio svalbardensis]|uniref:Glycosyl hydrolase-like 10 domain-containing protein n=1 Tax=Bdellovibrio svalbardensis TaxID=2972972 RepID=A0ABT6DMN4_9BACT|nr:hypothetical protein [Bdellovibrio svalbardensis]MDG0818125.1 hypothetical protein [Bdellovibrio svalbardensis]
MIVAIQTFLFWALTLLSFPAWSETPLRGLRVDPAYFSSLYPEMNAQQIANLVVNEAATAGATALFLYAYSSLHGSFYLTSYPLTEIEEPMGSENIFSLVYTAARSRGLKVIAVIPINDFKLVWQEHPGWRSKLSNGEDYKPFVRTHHLSAWHPEFRLWLKGFVTDLLNKFPGLYAIEVVEPTVDCFWTGAPDYNPAANAAFKKKFPKGKLGDENWRKIRALGMTELIASVARTAHAHNIRAAVVQTWPSGYDGKLLTSDQVRDQVGFDFDGALNLKGPEKIDILTGEFLWQQWAAEYGGEVFTPAWTQKAAHDFVSFVRNRSTPIIHVEISPWYGQTTTVNPTIEEFKDTLKSINNMGLGIDVYDHSQIEGRQAWSALGNWIRTERPTENTKAAE